MSRGLGLQEAESVIMAGRAHPTGEMNFEDAAPFPALIVGIVLYSWHTTRILIL